MQFSNTDHRVAVQCAQDILIALIMHGCLRIGEDDKEIVVNLKRSKRELDAAIKRLLSA